jgi:hypothetical protein
MQAYFNVTLLLRFIAGAQVDDSAPACEPREWLGSIDSGSYFLHMLIQQVELGM